MTPRPLASPGAPAADPKNRVLIDIAHGFALFPAYLDSLVKYFTRYAILRRERQG